MTNLYSFRPSTISSSYLEWPNLRELSEVQPFVGLEECRGGALIDIDKDKLEDRMKQYLNPSVDWQTLELVFPKFAKDAAGFNAKQGRTQILSTENFNPGSIRGYVVRPFDNRLAYYSEARPLWNRSRPTFAAQCWEGNKFLISRINAQANPEGVPMYMASGLFDKQTTNRNPGAFPIQLRSASETLSVSQQAMLFDSKDEVSYKANLSIQARNYLAWIGITNPDKDVSTAQIMWMHALAIGYAPTYIQENADGLKQGWPRIPLPRTKEVVERSSELGSALALLLDTVRGVPGVTLGQLRFEMKVIGALQRVNGGPLQPDEGDLEMTAGWGHTAQEGVTMPGKGKIIARAYTQEEIAAIEQGAVNLGLKSEQALLHLGDTTLDIYLNNVAYWRNVPKKVWEYTIGGYQVMKKWLSYRELGVLGRGLTVEEATEVRDMARRIAGILLLEPDLNANYEAVKQDTYSWRSGALG